MRSETELVPYMAGRLDGSPVLVVAPHPDDEVFGCGGVLRQAVRAGAEVRVVIVTDGAAQGDAGERRAEARAAAERLGVPDPEHWGLADRSLSPEDADLRQRLRRAMVEVRPAVVLAPSTAEVHPDHRAVALAVYRELQLAVPGTELHDAVAAVRLAAYEVSAALAPNLLVDVGDVWEDVLAAAKAYASQVGRLPYVEVMEGMASARRLTLPPSVRRAEAYRVVDLRFVRTHSAAEWAAAQGPTAGLEAVADAAPLDVIIRTKNRPAGLADALASLGAQLHPAARVIVVNDGGTPVDGIVREAAPGLKVDLFDLETGQGRARAAQHGLEAATASHVVFLDDDDRFLPEHLLALGRAVARGVVVPYTDAVQGVWEADAEGGWRPVARHRTFGGEFEPECLRLVNSIPLPTLALPRELALQVGGFDPEMDLYEDWDLLLRLAARTPFVHLPVVTCEYRSLAGGGAITAANPPGSPGQAAALRTVWERHGVLGDPAGVARAVTALVAGRDRQTEAARRLDERLIEASGERDGLRAETHQLRGEIEALRREVERLTNEAGEAAELRDEVARLDGILQKIYASKTWKLHRLVERRRRDGDA